MALSTSGGLAATALTLLADILDTYGFGLI
jgi:hypothetical protein